MKRIDNSPLSTITLWFSLKIKQALQWHSEVVAAQVSYGITVGDIQVGENIIVHDALAQDFHNGTWEML